MSLKSAENALLASACLGMVTGILLVGVAQLGTYPTAVAVLVGSTVTYGVGAWLHPDKRTEVPVWGGGEVLEDGDPS